jgi:hypothetical protein
MIAGYDHRHLEERINSALLSGIPYEYEVLFLHKMSERLLRRGRDAWLSDRQARWLNVILDRCEAGPRTLPKLPAHPPVTRNRSKQLKSDFVQKPIKLSDCMETTEGISDNPSLLNETSSPDSSLRPSPLHRP